MATKEVWRPIPGYEGYEASDFGRVRSVDREVQYGRRVHRLRGKILKTRPNNKGYEHIVLFKRAETVHKLVMLAFVGPCPEGMEVCHNNGKRLINRLSNLRYDTPNENDKDKEFHGTRAWGERSGAAKLTKDAVRVIRTRTESAEALAARYGVTANHIQGIWRGRAWRRLDAENTHQPSESNGVG